MKKKAPKKKAKAGVTVAHIPSIELTLSSPLVSIPAPTTNGAHPQAIQEEGSIPDDELYSPLDPTPVLPLLDPAALLLQTHNFLPSARFHELLQKHLVPLLESNHLLPEELKRTIAEALEEARATQEDENKYTQYIQYEEHKERIGELLVRGTVSSQLLWYTGFADVRALACRTRLWRSWPSSAGHGSRSFMRVLFNADTTLPKSATQ